MRAADRLLRHLGLEREAPALDYLHRIIREHQLRVPFETLTKLIDYEPGLQRGDFMPSMEEYVDRIVSRGAGGLCWTLARGLHALLQDLGFDVSLMIMEPGHCCVRVEMAEGPHYADVGYAAPIFRAYPLFESFKLDSPREMFEYRVGEEGILVTRTPGPTKTLDPSPRTLAQLHDLVTAANDWSAPHCFLRRLAYSAYVDGVYTSLNQGTLKRYWPSGIEATEIRAEEVPVLLTSLFRADPALHHQATEVHQRLGFEAA